MIDSDIIDSRVQIKKLILSGELDQAIKALNELNPEVSTNVFDEWIIVGFGQKSGTLLQDEEAATDWVDQAKQNRWSYQICTDQNSA